MTRSLMPLKLSIAAASIAVLGLAAVPAQAMQKPGSQNGAAEQSLPHPSALVLDQKLSDNTIELAYAYMPKGGFITVYKGQDGVATGKPIGTAALPAGDHRDVKVKLSSPVEAGTELFVSLADGTGDVYDEEKHASVWEMGAIPTESRFKVL